MLIEKNAKFALIGHGLNIFHLYEQLLKHKFPKPIVVTHEKKFHKRDIRESKDDIKLYKKIELLEKKTTVYYVKTLDSVKFINILKKNNINHIFSCSSRFIFKKSIINKFPNRIFNIHPSHLPLDKGGGTFTFRILNNDFNCSACIHLIDEGIDTGDIILKSKKIKIDKNSLPYDFIVTTNQIYKELIKQFVSKIKMGSSFTKVKQNAKNGVYYPRFYTDEMGFIDWKLNGNLIRRFIQACSKPYSGSKSYINGLVRKQKCIIYDAKFKKDDLQIHPFLYGKIFYEDNEIIKVFVKDGFLKIRKKDIKLFDSKIKKFQGKTFFNNDKSLLHAKSLYPNVFKYN